MIAQNYTVKLKKIEKSLVRSMGFTQKRGRKQKKNLRGRKKKVVTESVL